jgi:hypothetical protein
MFHGFTLHQEAVKHGTVERNVIRLDHPMLYLRLF